MKKYSKKRGISPMTGKELATIALTLNHGRVRGHRANLAILAAVDRGVVTRWFDNPATIRPQTIRLLRGMFSVYTGAKTRADAMGALLALMAQTAEPVETPDTLSDIVSHSFP